ncbi:hypothetical protein MKW92_013782 [Papaver armeniacum]|nr:hypothetical protein MKW92_013782 [Papaver armeniacum]
MYAGCGGMSTGLCMGAAASDVNLVTRWAVDMNEDACDSLRYNHPETQVRCMNAEDFLQLLIKWKDLCEKFSLLDADYSKTNVPNKNKEVEEVELETQTRQPYDGGDYEVEKIIGIFYGNNPDTNQGPAELHYKVKWKGWGSKWNTWEPASNLENCEESIEDFVIAGELSMWYAVVRHAKAFLG